MQRGMCSRNLHCLLILPPDPTCTACCPAAAVLFTLMVVREACLESGEAGLMTCAAV